VERRQFEVAVKGLEFKARRFDQTEPFVLARPPERADAAVVEDDVNSVVADGIVDRVRHRLVLVLAVEARRDSVVEGERIPGKATTRSQCGRDVLEAPATVGPGREVQQRPERAVDERRRLVEREIADVAESKVELDSSVGRTAARHAEHRWRQVDSDD
jgi:hypothetical protein